MGRRGLQEVASLCRRRHTPRSGLPSCRVSHFFSGPRFNEFVVRAPAMLTELLKGLAEKQNINGGLALSRYFC